jgi:hypothetical protein
MVASGVFENDTNYEKPLGDSAFHRPMSSASQVTIATIRLSVSHRAAVRKQSSISQKRNAETLRPAFARKEAMLRQPLSIAHRL